MNILKFGFAYMFLQVLRYMKKMLIHFFKTKWRRRTSRKQIPFFGGRTTTGRNFAPRTKNEKVSENIYKNSTMLTSFLYILPESFSFFVLRCKIATGSGPAAKKTDLFSAPLFCFQTIYFKKFMYFNTCRNMYSKPNFNIFIHFSVMNSIK